MKEITDGEYVNGNIKGTDLKAYSRWCSKKDSFLNGKSVEDNGTWIKYDLKKETSLQAIRLVN